MRSKPERIAWAILIVAFGLCVGLAVGVPLAARWLAFNLTVELPVAPEVTRGTLIVQSPLGQIESVSAGGHPSQLGEGSELTTAGDNAESSIDILNPQAPTATLGQIILYPDTRLVLTALRAPRFNLSPNSYEVQLDLERGRARVAIFPTARSTDASVVTPQTRVVLSKPGRYSIELVKTSDDKHPTATQVSFLEGQARAVWAKSSALLKPGQRTLLDETGPDPLDEASAGRNLILEGQFPNPIPSTAWLSYTESLDPAENLGRAEIIELVENQRGVLRFTRQGKNHAETGVIQGIDNGDVQGFSSLQLALSIQLLDQDPTVPVCGSLGSECPIMVELKYKDDQGTDRSWYQGFYYLDDPSGINPEFCVQCSGPRTRHIKLPNLVGAWHYEVDLIPVLTAGGLPKPARILSLRIYASGHSYQSTVSDVELVAQEEPSPAK